MTKTFLLLGVSVHNAQAYPLRYVRADTIEVAAARIGATIVRKIVTPNEFENCPYFTRGYSVAEVTPGQTTAWLASGVAAPSPQAFMNIDEFMNHLPPLDIFELARRLQEDMSRVFLGEITGLD